MQLNQEDIEKLKKYFCPKPEIVRTLPGVNETAEFVLIGRQSTDGKIYLYLNQGGKIKPLYADGNQVYLGE